MENLTTTGGKPLDTDCEDENTVMYEYGRNDSKVCFWWGVTGFIYGNPLSNPLSKCEEFRFLLKI